MGKYLIRYLIFCLPAIILSFFLQGGGTVAQVVLWFFAFFMLLGWPINTAMAAYRYPYGTLTALFLYSGFHILAISIVYVTDSRSGAHIVLRALSGLLSFRPLHPLLQVFKGFKKPLPGELIVICTIAGLCLVGFLVGVVHRRVNPDPYRPKMLRRQ